MNQTASDDVPTLPVRRRRKGRLGTLQAVWALLVFAVVIIAALSLSGAAIRLPVWATQKIEDAVNEQTEGPDLRIGRVDLRFGTNGRPQVRLGNVEITDSAGVPVAQLNDIGAELSPAALVGGRVVPREVRLSGAQVTLRRDAAGRISVAFGGTAQMSAATPGEAVAFVDAVFAQGVMADIDRIDATDITLTLEDARSGRVWQATGGTVEVLNGSEALSLTIRSEVFNGTEELAQVELSYLSPRGSPAATLGARFENADATDIALQSPALAVLGLLDARIAGSLRLDVARSGEIGRLAASLDIGAGRLRPAPEAQPFEFEGARAYVDFDPASGRMVVSEVSARTELVSVVADGQILLGALRGGWPTEVLAQFRLTDLDVAPGALFAAPLHFEHGFADLRLNLEPFALHIGQIALEGPHGQQKVRGKVVAAPDGWRLSLDVAAEEATLADSLALWPLRAAPGAREWLEANMRAGTLRDFALAIRVEPGARPSTGFSFSFEEAEARVMRHLPPITRAAGVVSLTGSRFALSVTEGWMDPGDGPPADLAGSTFVLPDTRVRPNPAELHLAAAGPAASLLRILDNPPFGVLARTARPEALLSATADATIGADVRFPVKHGLRPDEIRYEVAGSLDAVAAADLVPGRALGAERLSLRVTPALVELVGPVLVGELPLEAIYRMRLGPGNEGAGEVSARLDLTPETLAAIGIALPPGMVTGEAEGELELAIGPDGVGFRLTSNLVGARMSVAPLGWSKAPATAGKFEAEGRIVQGEARVDRLVLDAPGLSAEGGVEPGSGRVRFDRVRAGAWLDAAVVLTPRGPGRPPAVSIEGGQVNLARKPASTGDGGAEIPLRLALDRLIIADGLALASFRGDLTAGRGLSGSFEARVNGGAPVRGRLAPSGGRTAVRITAEDGGAVLRDAGLYPNARGGEFELVLAPADGPGRYDGQLSIGRTRVVGAPGLASLLNAVSVVGLLDELQGTGILFDTVDARFTLTPERVIVREGAAVGASLGISMDGVYEIAAKRMDMQGVVSPLYLVNGIGQIFTRRGEGLFGFAYRMTGTQGALRIEVNPLSILTPGMFRDIFRRPMPAAARQDQ